MRGIVVFPDRTGVSSEYFRLMLCLVLALSLCAAHTMGSQPLVLACLVGFLAISAVSSVEGLGIDVLLFFLPWSPLLKQRVGEVSLYTIALALTCLIALARRRFRVRPYQLAYPAILLSLTLLSKLFQGNAIDRGYLLFFFTLVLFPTLETSDCRRRTPFSLTCLYFSLGVISAALSAQLVASNPSIAQFINVESWAHVTRLSGYYGDANFYSAQINACIAGLLLVLIKETSAWRRAGCLGLLVTLLYCGLLSASKSFVIVCACEGGVWAAMLFRNSDNGRRNLTLLVAAAVVVLVALSTSAFQELLRILDNRFSYADSVSQITTGRSDVWLSYLDLLSRDTKLTLFGEGMTNVTLDVLRNKASHNTPIQLIFQLGILGAPVLVAWFACLLRGLLPARMRQVDGWAVALLAVGVFMPWLGLDYLFFDELFLLPSFAARGVCGFSDAPPRCNGLGDPDATRLVGENT